MGMREDVIHITLRPPAAQQYCQGKDNPVSSGSATSALHIAPYVMLQISSKITR